MSQKRPESGDPSAEALEEALEAKTAEFESLREGGARGVLTHVFFVLLCGVALMWLFVSLSVGLLSISGIHFTVSPMTASVVGLLLFTGSIFVVQRFVFVPKKGVDEMHQITVDGERLKLKKMLSKARAREAKRDEALAAEQRATRGGDLSNSTPSEAGGLAVHAAGGMTSVRAEERHFGLIPLQRVTRCVR